VKGSTQSIALFQLAPTETNPAFAHPKVADIFCEAPVTKVIGDNVPVFTPKPLASYFHLAFITCAKKSQSILFLI